MMRKRNAKGADLVVLAIDIGGSHVKIRSSAGGGKKKANSGKSMGGGDMVAAVKRWPRG
ncbi:hypothetical protein [Salinicola tamaricis]|uniref:hypothetical protein n=1 Tax=Salinicola tamaricis TaxID=1771309 RepID=UPI001A918A55|nr:hypothetical protein [Salinicola tamaricis]